MKKFLSIISVAFAAIVSAQTYPSMNISLLGNLDPCSVVNWFGANTKYSGVWGWVDPQDNREYAIMGGTDGYYFIDVTNPTGPVLADFEAGVNPNSLWREVKTYGNYCYMVSDDSGPNGMIIADLSYLPDSIHVVHKGNSIIRTAHTIYVDGNKLYAARAYFANSYHTIAVFSIANPAAPSLLGVLDDFYPNIAQVHDMWVQDDTVFASCAYDGLHVYEFDSTNAFNELGSYTNYPQAGYNHSSFRTADRQTLVFCDEVGPNLAVKVVDVSDVSNIGLIDTIRSNYGATPHNPYIVGNDYCYIAYYQDGLYLFNISDPANVTVAGYFDTHPQNGLNNGYPSNPSTYMGAWGAYPWLPSGNILVSDMQQGLFVLNAAQAVGVKENMLTGSATLNVYPNPAGEKLNLDLLNLKGDFSLTIYDINGRVVLNKTNKNSEIIFHDQLDVSHLSAGVYQVIVNGKNATATKKFVKQ